MTMNESTDGTAALTQIHRQLLNKLGIENPDALAPRYRSVYDTKELEACGFAGVQRRPGLLVTLYNVGRKPFLHQLHPDDPRSVRGRKLDQEFPRGSQLSLDVPPSCQPNLQNLALPLFVVNDPFEADALAALGHCVVDLLGMGQSIAGRKGRLSALKDWDSIALSRRTVCRVNSARAATDNMPRSDEATRLLVERGANVHLLAVPLHPASSSPQPLAQYLQANGSIKKLLESAVRPNCNSHHCQFAHRFIEHDGGVYEVHCSRDGEQTETPLANFTARIAAELLVSDGVEEHREFRVQACVAGQEHSCDVSASSFYNMDWVTPNLGAAAIVAPGPAMKDRLRVAIQQLSAPVPVVSVRSHIGWFEPGGEPMFVHAGGIIRSSASDARQEPTAAPPADETPEVRGLSEEDLRSTADLGHPVPAQDTWPGADVGPNEAGPSMDGPDRKSSAEIGLTHGGANGPNGPSMRASVSVRYEVRPPVGLELYRLPEPPAGERLVDVVLRTLKLTEAPLPQVFTALFAATFGAVLGGVPANLWIDAKTGNLKSTIVAIFARAFGPGFTPKTLPGSWNSTENALLALSHYAKDVLLVIDDWLPGDTPGAIAAQERKADFLFRSAANRAARGRCRSDGTLREARVPRSTLVSTAEGMPNGESLTARCVHLTCDGAALLSNQQHLEWLNERRDDAAAGVFAEAMAGFIKWLIPRLDTLRRSMEEYATELRNYFREKEPNLHPRQAENLADLLARFECFLQFAEDIGAIDHDSRETRFEQAVIALSSVAASAAQTQKEFNVADHILEIARTALLTGKRHLVSLIGEVPDVRAEACGWIVNRRWVQLKRGKHWTNQYGNPFPGGVGKSHRREDDDKGGDAHEKEDDDTDDSEDFEQRNAYPAGDCLGYVDWTSAYLLPEALVKLVVTHARQTNASISVNSRTLGRILRDGGKLERWDQKRCKCTVRRNVSIGSRADVYQVLLSELVPESWSQHPELEPGYEGDTPLEGLLEA